MSYDLAVWEGAPPSDDAAANAVYERLNEKYLETDAEQTPPTPRIRAYVEALLERWGDLTIEDADLSPWSSGPLMESALGSIVYFTMRHSRADEVSAEAARMAAERGLICFDPQHGCLRPAADERYWPSVGS